MKSTKLPGRNRRGAIPTLAALAVVALLVMPATGVYAQRDADATGLSISAWLSQAGALWTGLWTSVSDLFPTTLRAADTTDTGGTTDPTDPPPDTSGDGGFDGGGGVSVQDPNGGFGI